MGAKKCGANRIPLLSRLWFAVSTAQNVPCRTIYQMCVFMCVHALTQLRVALRLGAYIEESLYERNKS
jgi:hypothetical protein